MPMWAKPDENHPLQEGLVGSDGNSAEQGGRRVGVSEVAEQGSDGTGAHVSDHEQVRQEQQQRHEPERPVECAEVGGKRGREEDDSPRPEES
jgi:hypothetical protein